MKIHGTMVRIGGGPDKQGHVFSSAEGVEIDNHFEGSWLTRSTFTNKIEDIIQGTTITKVVKHPDRIDVEVDIDTDTCPLSPDVFMVVQEGGLSFAIGGKILDRSQTDLLVDPPITLDTIKRCQVTQLALTPNGVDPAYVVKLGPLPQD